MARVLFWTERFWPVVGGVATASRALLAGLRSRGFEFLVVTEVHPDHPDAEEVEGVRVRRYPFFSTLEGRDSAGTFRLRARIRELKADFDPDLIHTAFLGASCAIDFLAQGPRRVPRLLSFDADLPERRSASFAEKATLGADWVTSVSSERLQLLHARFPEVIERSRWIRTGMPAWDAEPSLSFDPPRIVSVGRLEPGKGFEHLLEAFVRVLELEPAAELVIVGDGSLRLQLQALAIQLGIENHVRWTGRENHAGVQREMRRASVVVLASMSEGLPNVLLEALALGRPIVSTRVGGIPSLVPAGDESCLVQPGDVTGLFEALCEVIRNPASAHDRALRCREHARALYGPECGIQDMEAVYRRLLGT